jgi:hypothetical protein
MKPFCKSRSVRINGSIVAQTPLPLPAFSSHALDSHLQDTVARIGNIVFGPILISAYDIHSGRLSGGRPDQAEFRLPLTFIDSGGYENLRLDQLRRQARESRPAQRRPGRRQGRQLCPADPDKKFSLEQYRAVLDAWPKDVRAVAVNYDRPSDDLGEQIEAATSLCPGRELGRELLLKPGDRVPIAGLINQLGHHAQALAGIDVIGVTEKEAGETLIDQLRVIANLRQRLDRIGFEDTPIHIFGGLDPIRTPLYFLAGADIFDGLTWLRYGFEMGRAVYIKALAAVEHPRIPINEAEWLVRRSNFFEITRMQTAMRKFLATKNPADLHEMGNRFLALLDEIDG